MIVFFDRNRGDYREKNYVLIEIIINTYGTSDSSVQYFEGFFYLYTVIDPEFFQSSPIFGLQLSKLTFPILSHPSDLESWRTKVALFLKPCKLCWTA